MYVSFELIITIAFISRPKSANSLWSHFTYVVPFYPTGEGLIYFIFVKKNYTLITRNETLLKVTSKSYFTQTQDTQTSANV
jgi:hypothetical protein